MGTAIVAIMKEMDHDPVIADLRLAAFREQNYLDINRARLQHLESLDLPLSQCRVLELGSGPGDLTGFYVERGCKVVAVDAREECLEPIRQRYPKVETRQVDLNHPEPLRELGQFDVIHCYGILYHLEEPARLIAFAGEAAGLLVMETCLSAGTGAGLVFADETADYTQSFTAKGCRPTRAWVFTELAKAFPFVYLTRTQPNHREFPTDWNGSLDHFKNIRSVFVGSRVELPETHLSPVLLNSQEALTTRS